jgi:endonuclease/exonuclease/phosphatase family metal-dependent hydrolase
MEVKMRQLLRIVAMSCIVGLTASCEGAYQEETTDDQQSDQATEGTEELALADSYAATSCGKRNEPTVKVVSANLENGGADRNWDTMERFIALVRDIDAPVLAVQETINAQSANRLLTRLDAVTGKTWAKQDTVGISPWGIATAIYWRTDKIKLVKSLGHFDLGKLKSNAYTIRFHGALLEKDGRSFAVFTGKLPWTGRAENEQMAPVLRDQIRDAMATYPNTVRIIGMDMNAVLYSKTWKIFNTDYDDSGATLGTFPSKGWFALYKRIDYIWVDRGSGPKETCAFLEPAHRSMDFGSDHRFVWGDIYLR